MYFTGQAHINKLYYYYYYGMGTRKHYTQDRMLGGGGGVVGVWAEKRRAVIAARFPRGKQPEFSVLCTGTTKLTDLF